MFNAVKIKFYKKYFSNIETKIKIEIEKETEIKSKTFMFVSSFLLTIVCSIVEEVDIHILHTD